MSFPMVPTPLAAAENAFRYASELGRSPRMQERLGLTHVWYAFRIRGGWAFAPAKYIAFANISLDSYLATAAERQGGNAEAHLRKWFETVADSTRLHAKLSAALNAFIASHGRTPRASLRIKVLKNDLKDLADLEDKEAPQKLIVDMMIAVARTLPKKQLKRLRKAIS